MQNPAIESDGGVLEAEAAFEARSDCTFCLVEGAQLELWDPARACCRAGIPHLVRCRVCGQQSEGRDSPGGATLVEITPGRRPSSEAELAQVLERWAHDDELGSAGELIEAYFVLPSSAELFAALGRGEPVETTFDVGDFLFGGGSVVGGSPATLARTDAPASIRPPSTQRLMRIGGPHDELLALASIASSDGEAGPDDLAVLARAAERRGVAPLAAEEIHVWRPNEIAPPPSLAARERVLEEMFQLAWSDGMIDESELRMIREFARAWAIDPVRVDEWTELYSLAEKHPIARWLGRMAHFLFPTD